jgi:VWFA-related protein
MDESKAEDLPQTLRGGSVCGAASMRRRSFPWSFIVLVTATPLAHLVLPSPAIAADYESTFREYVEAIEELVRLLKSVDDRPSAVAAAPRAKALWTRVLGKGNELVALDPSARNGISSVDDKTHTFQINENLINDRSLIIRINRWMPEYWAESARMLKTPAMRPLVVAYLGATGGADARRAQARVRRQGRGDSKARTGAGGATSIMVRQADESRFPEIRLDFEVRGADGSPILDARQADFEVTESGEPVEILRFFGPTLRGEARRTTVVLVVDHSVSMAEDEKLEAMQGAVAAFLKAMPQGCKVAVVAFSDEVETICDFTGHPRRVQAAVDALGLGTKTRCYDALLTGLEMLKEVEGRRAILCLTDGEDIHSTATLDEVIAAARRPTGAPIYTVGLGSDEVIDGDVLGRLAEETRGEFFPVRGTDQLRGIFEEFATRQGQLYQVVYRTNRQVPDGTLRPVRIFFRGDRSSTGKAEFYIRGMVVPAPLGSGLFLGLLAALCGLAILPGRLLSKRAG